MSANKKITSANITAILSKKFGSSYLPILKKLNVEAEKRPYGEQIRKELNIPQRTFYNRVNRLQQLHLIKKNFRSSFIEWEITKEGKEAIFLIENPISANISQGIKNQIKSSKVRPHNFCVEFDISKDNDKADWQKKNILKGTWYAHKDTLKGFTIMKHPKKIYVYFHNEEIPASEYHRQKYMLAMKGSWFIYGYLKNKRGIEIDLMSGKTVSQEIARQLFEQESNSLDQSTKLSLDLNRKAQSFFPTSLDATAWIDFSKKKGQDIRLAEQETNDDLYGDLLLRQPESIHHIREEQAVIKEQQKLIWENQIIFAENLNKHLAVLDQMNNTLKALEERMKK